MAASTAMVVFNADRSKREQVAKQGLRSFIREAATKLGVPDASSNFLALYEDGTEIDDMEYFDFVDIKTPLMLLTSEQRWKAPGRDETDSSAQVLNFTTDLSGVIHMSSEELAPFADSDFGAVFVRSDLQQFIVEASRRVRKDREVMKRADRLVGDDTTDTAARVQDLELGATPRSVRLSFSAGEPSKASETQDAHLRGGGDEPVDHSALSSQELREMRGNAGAEKELRSRLGVENALKSLKKLTEEKGNSRVKGGAASKSKDSPDGGSEDLTQLLHLLREDPGRILGLRDEQLELLSEADRYSVAGVVGHNLGDALRWASLAALASHHKLDSLLELYQVVESR